MHMVCESDEHMQLGPAVLVLRVTLVRILEYHDAFSLSHLIESLFFGDYFDNHQTKEKVLLCLFH